MNIELTYKILKVLEETDRPLTKKEIIKKINQN